MGIQRLKRIDTVAYRSFAEPASVSFPGAGIVLVRGHNKDTGGSSGSGKTSINVALATLLGHNPWPLVELQSWLTEQAMQITGEWETDVGQVIVQVGAKKSLTVNGTKVKGGAKAIDAKMREIFGDPQLLAACTYRGQRQDGIFLSKTDADRKEFLMTLLGLDRFESAIDGTADSIKALEAELAAAEWTQNNLTNAAVAAEPKDPELEDLSAVAYEVVTAGNWLAKVKTQLSNLEQTAKAHAEQEVVALKLVEGQYLAQIEAANRAVEEASNHEEPAPDRAEVLRLSGLIDSCQARVSNLIAADKEQAGLRALAVNMTMTALDSLKARKALIPHLQSKYTFLENEIARIKANVCPTCGQEWIDKQEVLKRKEDELVELSFTIAGHETAVGQRARLEAELEKLGPEPANPMIQKLQAAQQELSQQKALEIQRLDNVEQARESKYLERVNAFGFEAEKLKRAYLEARNAVPKLSETLIKDSLKVSAEVSEATSVLANAQKKMQETESRNRSKTEHYEHSLKYLEEVVRKLNEATAQVDGILVRLRQEQDFADVIGREGFLGSIFDEVLAEISDETNRILAGVANTRHCTLEFRSESVTQKGTVKKSIIPVVTIGGKEAPMRSGLSGGMIGVVELAVDLAVGTVISRRVGKYPGWLVLDECFEGLGPVEKESTMEILQMHAQDRMILVVDHTSEFQEMFTQFIDVEYQNGYSTIVKKAL